MRLNCVSGRRTQAAIMTWVVLFIAVPVSLAQSTSAAGSITGVVTDPNGAAAGGLSVIVTDLNSRHSLTLMTTANGLYSSGPIIPATYRINLEVTGFASVQFQVSVHVGTTVSGNIRLQPARAAKKESEAAQVDLDETTVQGIITSQQLEELPVNGRNYLSVSPLEPGAQIIDAAQLNMAKSGFFGVSLDGQSASLTRTMLDGIDITDERLGTTTQNISLSSIREFQIALSTLNLSSPMTSSGTVNVITRTGGNAYHGGGFYNFRDNDLGFAAFPAGQDSYFQRNQFGGDLGGALIQNKLFFFVSGERTKQDWNDVPSLQYPFNSLGVSYKAPFRDNTALGRLDWTGENTRAFYRATYDEDSAVGPGNSYSPFLAHDDTPGQALGLDFYRGSFTHSLRFGYTRYASHLNASSEAGSVNPDPLLSIQNSSIDAGPNALAPQSMLQSNKQFRYDGTRVWNAHVLRFGASYNRISTGGYEAFGSMGPVVTGSPTFANEQTIFGNLNAYAPALIASDPAGALDNPLNYPVASITLSNGQRFFTANSGFGFPHGELNDNRLEFYAGDAWKVRPRLTINYGVHYLRDGGLVNSDLPGIPALNGVAPTLGNAVHQPNLNFSPELGIAWAPRGGEKTVVRAGIGLYYDSNLSENFLADRALRSQQGQYYAQESLCGPGEYSVYVPNGPRITSSDGLNIATQICGHPLSSVVNGVSVAKAITDLQSVFQTASATSGANGFYAGTSGSTLGSMISPNYVSPRSVNMNVGVQHQFGRATVFSLDYVRNSGTHFLLGVDRNHVGDANNFNLNNAVAAINRTLAANAPACGQVNASTSISGINCYLHQVHNASISDFAVHGLDSSGEFANSTAAFPGNDPNLGQAILFSPIGDSRYRAVDVSVHSTVDHPIRDIQTMNLQASYSWSKYQSNVPEGGGLSNNPNGLPNAVDSDNPNFFFGPTGQDRTHQISFGPILGLRRGFRLSILGNIDSPLPLTLFLPQLIGGGQPGEIFRSDVSGDGSIGDIVPGSNIGAFRGGASATNLNTFVSSYNANFAGHLTAAGSALVNNGLFAQTQLLQLGGVTPSLASVPENSEPAWLKTVDVKLSWPYVFKDRYTIEPSVSAFNVFNFANFNSSLNPYAGVLAPAAAFPPNGGLGLGCGTATSCQSSTRVGPGSGVFSLGSARELEFGVRLTF